VKPTADEFAIKSNFPCLKCEQFPVGCIQQCQECEGLYCEWCAEQVKDPRVCLNKDCASKELKTAPIGKILKSMISTFEFKHDCQRNLYTYNDLVAHLEGDCESNKTFKCPTKDCTNQELMTQAELKKHMIEDCAKIEVECSLCAMPFQKDTLNDQSIHNCAKELRKKVDKAR